MSEVTLTVNDKIYAGWTGLKAVRGIEQGAGAFAIELTERFPGEPQKWPIHPGDACKLALDEEVVITGFVDRAERALGPGEHSVRVDGRDAAGDVVDSSARLPGDKTGNIRNMDLLEIAQLLCDPIGIDVRAEVAVGKRFDEWSVDAGESVWENLSRGARQRALLIVSDGAGGLVITRAGETVNSAMLVEGENVIEAHLIRDDSQRFHTYIARGQNKTDGTLDAFGEIAAHVEARTVDFAIRESRTLIIVNDDLADGVTLKDRIEWERNVRRGQGRQLTVSVQGWSARGRVWRPNEMVVAKIPTLGMEGPLLIVSVTNVLDSSGTRTELSLAPREAYDLVAEAKKKKGGGLSFALSPQTLELLK